MPPLNLESRDAVAVLSWKPKRGLPRLTRATLEETFELLNSIAPERAFRGVVLVGNPESFAVGADLQEIAALDPIEARAFARDGQRLFDLIEHFPIPAVAAIRGFCFGGGFDLALACHARVAAYDASFGHPGAALGLVTGWGGTGRLPRLVGKSAALRLILTAERVPAAQALTMGLVDELVSTQDLTEAAVRRADYLASCRQPQGEALPYRERGE